jgi:hypothetical protein
MLFRYPPMGYDLHITRKSSWADKDGPTIPEAEWRRIIAEDPELKIDTETQGEDWVFASWRDDPGLHKLFGVSG